MSKQISSAWLLNANYKFVIKPLKDNAKVHAPQLIKLKSDVVQLDLSMSYINSIICETGSKSVPLGLCNMRGHLSHFLAVLKPPNMSFMKKTDRHCWQKTDRHCCDFPNSIQLICNINRWKHKPTTPMTPGPILPFLKLDVNTLPLALIKDTY